MTAFEVLQEFEHFYNALKPAQENTPKCFAWFSGIPHPLFNAVMHLKSDKNLVARVDALISQAPTGVPLSFWVHSQNASTTLTKVLSEKGFRPLIVCPLMTWSVRPIALPSSVIKPAHLEIFNHILATVYHFDEVVKEGFSTLIDNRKAEHYLIHLDDRPVGTGTIITNGETAGVFNMATLPEYQKRGCGRTMTQFLMKRAFDLGLKKLVLLSSPIAENLYSDLGFTKCFDIAIYAR